MKPSLRALSRPLQVLRIDASARHQTSATRALGDALVQGLIRQHGDIRITRRDLATAPLPFVDEAWVQANATPQAQRSDEQHAVLRLSDGLVNELMSADVLLIGVPLYNFSIPAALKAWIDLVARARLTFRYTAQGSEGLLQNKRAWLLVASGGVAVGSAADFATGYLRHLLAFLGITDVQVIAADALNQRGDAALQGALQEIEATLPGQTPRAERASSVA